MKIKNLTLLASVFAVIFAITIFSGCGGKDLQGEWTLDVYLSGGGSLYDSPLLFENGVIMKHGTKVGSYENSDEPIVFDIEVQGVSCHLAGGRYESEGKKIRGRRRKANIVNKKR
jgi:hypothetical protein